MQECVQIYFPSLQLLETDQNLGSSAFSPSILVVKNEKQKTLSQIIIGSLDLDLSLEETLPT